MGHRKPDVLRGDPPYPSDRWKPHPKYTVPGMMAMGFYCKCPDCGQWVDAMVKNIRPPRRIG